MSDLKIFANSVEAEALRQCEEIMTTDAFKDAKVRIMPDVHVGKGCVIGFSAINFKGIIPSVIGCDIGCGMTVAKLKNKIIDFDKFDKIINRVVPSGQDIHEKESDDLFLTGLIKTMRCYDQLKDVSRILKSVGTLGSGNHFIEIDEGKNGDQYLIIHSGSRNLGKQVEAIYTEIANRTVIDNFTDRKMELIDCLKRIGLQRVIQPVLKEVDKLKPKINSDTLYALPKDKENDYLFDIIRAQSYAVENRRTIVQSIVEAAGLEIESSNEVMHNYIDFTDFNNPVVHKGSISAKKGEFVIIPLNMRDGCIIGYGKGNDDWNQSAPHGAGRSMSRSEANRVINMDDFAKAMAGIYTSSVCETTKDEAPFAYKNSHEIIDLVSETVEITEVIRPIYNFKAH